MKNRLGNLAAIMLIAVSLLGLPIISGCATSKTTTTTETTVSKDKLPATEQTTETTTTTQTETTKEEPHRSIVGGTLHVIGQIIAFPFRMIGKAFSLIF